MSVVLLYSRVAPSTQKKETNSLLYIKRNMTGFGLAGTVCKGDFFMCERQNLLASPSLNWGLYMKPRQLQEICSGHSWKIFNTSLKRQRISKILTDLGSPVNYFQKDCLADGPAPLSPPIRG